MRYDLIILGGDTNGLQLAEAATARGMFVAYVLPAHEVRSEFVGQNHSLLLEIVRGNAEFVTADTVVVRNPAAVAGGNYGRRLTAESIVIANGSHAIRSSAVYFDGKTVLDSDEANACTALPQSAIIVGAGRHGLQLAVRWARLGVTVRLVDATTSDDWQQNHEPELHELRKTARALGVQIVNGCDVITAKADGRGAKVFVTNGWPLKADVAVFAVGRSGCTAGLNLPNIGLFADDRERLWCDEQGGTWTEGVFGFGEVIGFAGERVGQMSAELLLESILDSLSKRAQPAIDFLADETETVIPQPHSIRKNRSRSPFSLTGNHELAAVPR